MNHYYHAKKWVELAEKEIDYFDKFVYCYFALNALYNPHYERSERQAICTLFKRTYNYNYGFKEEMRNILNTKEIKYFINRRPIRNCKYNPEINPNVQYDTAKEKALLLSNNWFSSNQAMLMIIYQIRCNLFHGNKQYYDENDQDIMKNASILLLKYMKAFVKYPTY